MYSIICIFTHYGRTYTFKDITIVCSNETMLSFSYTAMSDGKMKTANFPKANLCGWSVTEKEEIKSPYERVDHAGKASNKVR